MCVCPYPCILLSVSLYPCYSIDEIEWPEGDDALPAESQDLITKLLRQSPLERLGTGWCFSLLALINACLAAIMYYYLLYIVLEYLLLFYIFFYLK